MPMQEKNGRHFPNAIAPSFAISVTLHMIAILAVGFFPTRKLPPPPIEQSITVEILNEPQTKVTAQPTVIQNESKPIALPAPIDQTPEQDTKPAMTNGSSPQGSGMVRAKELFSAKVLADPRSKEALVALKQLGRDDRVIQLCNVEAMEQVHIWKPAFSRISSSPTLWPTQSFPALPSRRTARRSEANDIGTPSDSNAK
ncbi:DUF930 domain-containing protein [Rhizobium nepotum]|uniref:DUF930 domain-containing protein n=1 Tax=Rhizobium nepotum TaxID=1035271 RepID=UPI001F2D9F85|nr:DUF930 domain-containing protein [Rhizobium nepotum]